MGKKTSSTLRCLMLMLTFGISLGAPSQDTSQPALAGRPFAFSVVRGDDLSPVHSSLSTLKLATISAPLTQGSNAYLLLQSWGIAPDSQAFAALYDLNPRVKDLDNPRKAIELKIPAVSDGEALQELRKHGFLVQLTLDPHLHNELNNKINQMQTFASSIDKLAGTPDSQEKLRRLLSWYGEILKRFERRSDPPLRQDAIVAMNEEASALLVILQDAAGEPHVLTSAQVHEISSIYDDVGLDVAQYGEKLGDAPPPPPPSYSVTVTVIGAPPSVADKLRVYYTFNGLFHPLSTPPPVRCFPFQQVGLTAHGSFSMKYYQIWAALDGDPNHPLTPPLLLAIEPLTPGELTVDLRYDQRLTR